MTIADLVNVFDKQSVKVLRKLGKGNKPVDEKPLVLMPPKELSTESRVILEPTILRPQDFNVDDSDSSSLLDFEDIELEFGWDDEQPDKFVDCMHLKFNVNALKIAA